MGFGSVVVAGRIGFDEAHEHLNNFHQGSLSGLHLINCRFRFSNQNV